MSMEFLIGRSMMNAMVNLGIDSECEEALHEVWRKCAVGRILHVCVQVQGLINTFALVL